MVRVVRVQRCWVYLTEGGGRSTAVVVLVAGSSAAVWPRSFHFRDLGLDQAGRRESGRGAAVRTHLAADVVVEWARACRTRYAIRHATWATA